MRLKYLLSAALGGAFTLAGASPALAGSNCGTVSGDRCNPGYVYSQSPVVSAPISTHYGQPYDHLRRSEYVQTPQINVTRIETGRRHASLSDAPAHAWAGCGGGHGQITCAAPAPAPIMARPMPVMPAPVMMAPAPVVAPAPLRSYSASHSYDASKYVSRQYGSADFVPGIAHIPTSIVDRSVANRDAILASGTTVAQPVLHTNSSYSTVSNTVAQNMDGTSWTRASGPTFVDGMFASEVLCKQPAPAAPRVQVHQQAYQVVRPVVNVPYPVPVAVPGPVVDARGGQSRYGSGHAQNNCAVPAPRPMPYAGPAPRSLAGPTPIMRRIAPGHATQAPRSGGRYGASTWTY